MVGRAAISGEILELDVPSDYLTISSGLGETPAPFLMILPLVQDAVSVGVVELAFLRRPDVFTRDMLKSAAPMIAVRLRLATAVA